MHRLEGANGRAPERGHQAVQARSFLARVRFSLICGLRELQEAVVHVGMPTVGPSCRCRVAFGISCRKGARLQLLHSTYHASVTCGGARRRGGGARVAADAPVANRCFFQIRG